MNLVARSALGTRLSVAPAAASLTDVPSGTMASLTDACAEV